MKKLILFFLSFLMSVGLVAASGFPMVISGEVKLNDVIYANQKVEVVDANLGGESWDVYTNGNGQYQVVLNNLRDSQGRQIYPGHTIYVDACDYDVSTNCRRTTTASYEPESLSWDLAVDAEAISDDAIEKKDIDWCKDTVCEDSDCPDVVCGDVTCPTCDGNEVKACPVCDNGTCPEPEDEDDLMKYVYWALFAVVGTGVGGYGAYKGTQGQAVTYKKGTGFKAYVGNDGTMKGLHKHPGTRGYHNPNNKHSPLKERHPIGKKVPQYNKDDKGEWKYVG